MKSTISGIRGTHDFSPPEVILFNKIIEKTRRIFTIFGYEEIKLPILEEKRLFVKGIGQVTDIVEKQMFKISRDGQDKEIVLRPEGTAQVIRYYLQNFLYKKSDFFKFFYIGPMFRGERPQKGRLRQFHHLGVEAIGSNSFYLDAEIINLANRVLEEIGVNEKEIIINSLGCLEDKKRLSYLLKSIFLKKKNRLCKDCQNRLEKNPLRILDCKNQSCKELVGSLDIKDKYLCKNCKEHFVNLLHLLDDLNIKYNHLPTLVRGLDYYTNTVFEIISKKLGAQDAIGAGGRYNNLVKALGGPDKSCVGFALGVERILLVLNEPEQFPEIDIFVAVTSSGLIKEGFKILDLLRKEGISSDIDYCDKSLKGQLRFAQKKKAKYVVILGEEEEKEGCVLLRDMRKSIQEKIKKSKLQEFLKNSFEKKE
jgi:histidyl-tRNA synthetase